MIYLAEKEGKFLPTNIRSRAEVISWLMFQMASTNPVITFMLCTTCCLAMPAKCPYSA